MKPPLACAIYTRKSSEEGLEQDFNSIDAQREACEAYVRSQKAEGWQPLPERYDDGGFSGGNMDRPALQSLMSAIATGTVQVVVVYKVDRLTRSLADFAKIVEQFDARGVSFVSVTQQFNTTSSMGRLTLNVLLSFAQFEREVTGERIRDKIAASKQKGMWMGGIPPVGYRPHERSLAIDPPQAERIREIFRLYLELNCVRKLKNELDCRGWLTPPRNMKRQNAAGERPFSRGHLYRILSNPIYVGRIAHKGVIYSGRHPAIIEQELWEQVQAALDSNRQGNKRRSESGHPSMLAGLVFDANDGRLTPTHACKGTRRYRYYVSEDLIGKTRKRGSEGLRIPAPELETAVLTGITTYLSDKSRLLADLASSDARACQSLIDRAQALVASIEEASAIERMDLVNQILERVVVAKDGLILAIRPGALGASEMRDSIVVAIPARFQRCGLAVKLIVQAPGARNPPKIDHRLVRLIDRGIGWFNRMTAQNPEGVGAIAKADDVAPSFVIRLAYLAFLAPDIVDAIRKGAQPPTLTVDRLTRMVPLPMDWGEQRRGLGFGD